MSSNWHLCLVFPNQVKTITVQIDMASPISTAVLILDFLNTVPTWKVQRCNMALWCEINSKWTKCVRSTFYKPQLYTGVHKRIVHVILFWSSTHNMQYLMLFSPKNGYVNASECYISSKLSGMLFLCQNVCRSIT